MRYDVKVQANARTESVEVVSPTALKVKLRVPALEGRANQRLIEVLSQHFDVPKSQIQILRGERSKNKIVQILGMSDSA